MIIFWTGLCEIRRVWVRVRTHCFPGGSDGKESACNAGDPGLIPRLGRNSGEGNGYPLPLQCSLFKNLFMYFNWKLITLQYCGGFCHTLTWISHGCTCVPYPEPLSHLPPHPICQGHPSAPVLSTLSHTSNLDWLSISHMVSHTCFNAILSNHPTLTFSHEVQKSVLDLCVSFAVLHIGSLLPSF